MSAVFAALILLAPLASGAAQPARTPAVSNPTYIKVADVAYVDARVFLSRYGFSGVWVEPSKVMRLQSVSTRIELTVDKRDAVFNDLRVLLGEPVVFRGSTLYVSRIDAEKLFLPIVNPAGVTAPVAPALKVIVIDAGHGGSDTGTQNKPLKMDEKTFTLDVANRLRTLLVKQGYSIVMTRTDDRFISLQQRAEIANKANADLFISIHFNAVGAGSPVRGSETYVMTPQFQRSTGSGSREPSDNIANPGNLNDPWNALLGYHMHAQMMNRLNSVDRGFKRARFAVLRLVNSPAVLVEAGYLSNSEEAKKIASPSYRADIAEAFADGVRAYAKAISSVKKK